MAGEYVYGVFAILDKVRWASNQGQPTKPVSFACAHCKAEFLVNTALKKNSAKCPHCQKTSVVKEKGVRNWSLFYLCFGLFWLIVGIAVTVGTVEGAKATGGEFVIIWFAIIVGVCYILWAAIYACRTKTSHPVAQEPPQDMP